MAQQQKQNEKSGRTVRDVMTPDPRCVNERDSIRDVARIMKAADTGVVPVLNGKKVVGLITDRDIVVRGLAEERDVSALTARQLMTTTVRSVREDTPVHEVLELMSSFEVRRVPVVNASDELVGIVSIGDISTSTNQDNKVGKVIEQISEAPPNN